MLVFLFENPLIIGEARSDGSGRFRIDAPRTSSSTHDLLRIMAFAPGHGLGWVDVGTDAVEPSAMVTLPAEFVIEGRLFDVQGQPVRGAKVLIHAISSARSGQSDGPLFRGPCHPSLWLPGPHRRRLMRKGDSHSDGCRTRSGCIGPT